MSSKDNYRGRGSSGGRRYMKESNKTTSSSREISSTSGHSSRNSAESRLRGINIKRVVSMVLCIVFLLFGGALFYYDKVLDSMNFQNFSDPAEATEPDVNTDPSGSENQSSGIIGSTELLSDSKVLNVLLFGDDTRDISMEDYGRSDTMILMSVDNRHSKIKFTSFQRDVYVNIPGYGYNKLNASYSYGGPQLAIQTIEANFGVNIDRYALVGFESFKKIIDTLNGVEIELDQDEIDYINHQLGNDPNKIINDSPGLVRLNGEQALWYARDRGWDYAWDDFKVSGDDWDRTSRQRNLMRIIMSSMKSSNLTQLLSIISQVGPLVTTNLKKNEITVLATHALKYLSYDTDEVSIPMEGQWRYSWSEDKQSIIEVTDWNKCRRTLAEFIYEEVVSSSPSASE